MPGILDGQVVVVTGAARGLGRAYALDLAAQGATVVAIGRPASAHDVQRVVDEIEHTGGTAVALYHSVTTASAGEAIVAETLARFGKIDALVNNAGNLRPALFEDVTDEQLDETFLVHVAGAFHVTRPAFRAMKERSYGRIVNTSSNTVFGFAALTGYGAAKGALLALSNTLALEGAAYDIRVNTVLPVALTTLIPENPIPGLDEDDRLQQAIAAVAPRLSPRTVAPLVTYLASPACAVSGEAFSALGGRYARVFFGVTDGWIGPDPDAVSADDIAAHVTDILDLARFSVPQSIHSEFEAVNELLAQAAGPPRGAVSA